MNSGQNTSKFKPISSLSSTVGFSKFDSPNRLNLEAKKKYFEKPTEDILSTTRDENNNIGYSNNDDLPYSKEFVDQLKVYIP